MVRDGGGAPEAGEAVDEARFGRRPPKAQVGALEGFNLHASVVIGATDHEGRERLLRYVARLGGATRGRRRLHGRDGAEGGGDQREERAACTALHDRGGSTAGGAWARK